MAADLPYKAAVKAKPIENDDICIKGICVYGDFDMGVAYQNHGARFAPLAGGPLDYLVSKNSDGAYFGVAANMISNSFIGLRGKQEIADNLYAVFNLQTLFNTENGHQCERPGLDRAEQWSAAHRRSRTRSATPRRPARCSTRPPTSASVRRSMVR